MTESEPQSEPFAPPYVLNPSSVVLNGETEWPMSPPPPPPAGPPRRRWVVPVVVVGVLTLVGGLIGAGAAEFQTISQWSASPDNPGSLIGVPDAPPGSDGIPSTGPTPVAVVCPPTCFTVASAGQMVPDGSLQISMPIHKFVDFPGFEHPTSAAVEYTAAANAWSGVPDCFLLGSRSPTSPILGAPDSASTDPVTLLGKSEDESGGSTITQSARFFPTSAAATGYMRTAREQAEACQLVDRSAGSTPSFDLQDPMAINAFAQISGSSRTYVYDIQRANAIVRFRVTTTNALDEDAVVHFLHTWATTNLAQLDAQ